MRKLKVKHILGALLLLALSFPFLQQTFKFFKSTPLNGAIHLTSMPKPSIYSWFDGHYQSDFEKYYNDHFGFRPEMIRLKNQWDYSLFNTLNARGIVMGRNEVLFDKAYLVAYNGLDYVGTDSIRKVVGQLKELQHLLEKHNRSLLVCFAPSKAHYFKDCFPENFPRIESEQTNYKTYLREMSAARINYFDFNHWFSELKDTSSCQLMVKNGIHWSQYGALLAADKLLRVVEENSSLRLPYLVFDSIERSRFSRFTDDDLSKTLNLRYPLPSEECCYPQYRWIGTDSSDRPKVLVIGDSFYWNLYNIGLGRDIFQYGGFWYYNREIYPDNYQKPSHVGYMDVTEKLIDNEVYILLVSEPNLTDFPWKFVEKAIEIFSQYKGIGSEQ